MQQDKILSALSDIARKKSSGGGGGAGDASASNQALQLAQETVSANKLTLIEAKTPALASGRVPVDGSGVTQPVSGTISVTGVSTAANQATQITALGTLATSAKQSDGSQKSQIVDGSGNVITSSTLSGKQRLDVNLAAGGVPTSTAPNWADQVGGVDNSGNLQPLQMTAAKNLKVDVQVSTLPTGAATAANQSTEITALNQLHTDLLAATPAGSAVIGKVDLNNTSLISTVNSSATPLAANGVFTGTSEDISQYSEVRVTVFSDVASATDGLQMQQSTNGTNWDTLDVYSIPAGTAKTFGVGVSSQFFRLVYTNGVTLQSSFRLQVTYKKLRTKPSSIRPQDARTNDNDMEEVVAYHSIFNGTSWDRLRGDTTNGMFVNVKTSVLPTNAAQETGGNLATVVTNTSNTAAKLPTAFGQQAASTSLGVALSNEQVQDMFVTGQSAQSASGNNIFLASAGTGSVDTVSSTVSYRSFYAQIIGTAGIASGQIIFEGSNDNTTFNPITVYDDALTTAVPIVAALSIAASTNRYFSGKTTYKFVRCRISTVFSGGTVQAITRWSITDYIPRILTVAQPTAANLNVTIGSGTITTVTGATITAGQTVHSSASTGAPVRIGGRVVSTTITADDITLAAGDASDVGITSAQQVITKDFGTSELDGYTPILPSVTTTTPQSIVAASGQASIRNYITQVSIQTDTLGSAGNMFIVDNQGAIGTSVTIATPGVFTSTTHDLRIGDTIIFTSLGTITGISTNTLYYVTATSLAATTFTVALTPGGTAIAITGSTSAFTFYRVFYMFRLNTAALATPFVINPVNPYKGIANSNLNVYFPSSLLTGTVYININGYRGF